MTEEHKYGKSPFNPVRVHGIEAALVFINSILTEDNKPFVYHRIHTTSVSESKPIDCYEILKEGYVTDILYFDSYADKTSNEMPEGYCKNLGFVQPILIKGKVIKETTGVNYKLREFPNDLIGKL